MTFWPFLHFFGFILYSAMAFIAILRNPRARINHAFALFIFSLAVWSFGKIFVHSPHTLYVQAQIFEYIASFGWIGFSASFFWFSIVFTNRDKNWRPVYSIILIGITLFFLHLQFSGGLLEGHSRQLYGWGNVWRQSLFSYLFFSYYFIFMVLSIAIFFKAARASKSEFQQKQAVIILLTVTAPLLFGTLTDVVFPLFKIARIPEIADVSAIFCPIGVLYAMAKYKFLTITPAMAADNIISTMADFLILVDPQGKVITVNNAILKFLGYEEKDVVDKDFSVFFPMERPARDFFEEIKIAQSINSRECYFRNKNGIDAPVIFSASALRDENALLAGFVCIVRDISEFKKTEDVLWRAKEELEEEIQLRTMDLRLANEQLALAYKLTRDILQKAPFGIYVVNSSGTVEYANEAMVTIAGRSEDELARTNIFSINAYNDLGLTAKIKAVFDSDEPFVMNSVKVDSYYSKKPAVVNYRGISMEEAGRKALIFVEDVTDKLRLEDELIKAHKLESVGILAGGIAHDFNNILSIILSNVSFVRISTIDNPSLREPLLDAEKATRRARDLTQQLLIFSRGGMPVKKVVNIDTIITDTVNFALQGSRSRAQFDIKNDLWPVEIDVGQINQVIQNLVINADQAMSQGGTIAISAVNLEIKKEQSLPLAPGRHVKISVKDSGIGIPPEHLQKIFDPYFTTKQKGSGLGLAIAYSVIKKHNGLIVVDSKLGHGANFDIYLPACDSLPDEVHKPAGAVFPGHGSILVMDDEEYVRNSLLRGLKSLGYEATAASRGEEALDLYAKSVAAGKMFDLVILDLTIPAGMGGLKALEELKKINPFVKAVVSSGYSNDPVMADYAKYGFIDVLAKPYDVKTLSEVAYRALHV